MGEGADGGMGWDGMGWYGAALLLLPSVWTLPAPTVDDRLCSQLFLSSGGGHCRVAVSSNNPSLLFSCIHHVRCSPSIAISCKSRKRIDYTLSAPEQLAFSLSLSLSLVSLKPYSNIDTILTVVLTPVHTGRSAREKDEIRILMCDHRRFALRESRMKLEVCVAAMYLS